MAKRPLVIFTQFTMMFIIAFIFTVLWYNSYHFLTVVDQFDNLVSQTTEKARDISDSQMDFEEIVSDIQETLVYDDTTVLSVTNINQSNLQVADDEWKKNKRTDKFQGK